MAKKPGGFQRKRDRKRGRKQPPRRTASHAEPGQIRITPDHLGFLAEIVIERVPVRTVLGHVKSLEDASRKRLGKFVASGAPSVLYEKELQLLNQRTAFVREFSALIKLLKTPKAMRDFLRSQMPVLISHYRVNMEQSLLGGSIF